MCILSFHLSLLPFFTSISLLERFLFPICASVCVCINECVRVVIFLSLSSLFFFAFVNTVQITFQLIQTVKYTSLSSYFFLSLSLRLILLLLPLLSLFLSYILQFLNLAKNILRICKRCSLRFMFFFVFVTQDFDLAVFLAFVCALHMLNWLFFYSFKCNV